MRYIFILMIILSTPVFSYAEILPQTIYAITPAHINYKNLTVNKTIELYQINKTECENQNIYEHHELVDITIKEYIKAKRGKRSGYYKIIYKNRNDIKEGTMRASTPKDFENIAKQAGIAITGHILKVPGFSQVVAVSKGLLKPNENQNRLQSAGNNLYQSTPLTYIEKGTEFDVEEDGIVVLKLHTEDKDNQ